MAPHRRMVHLEGSGDQSELCSLTVMEKTSHRTPKSPQVPAVDYKQREGPEMGRVEGQDHHLWPEHRRGTKASFVYQGTLWCPGRKPPSQTESPLLALGDLGNTFARPLVCVFRLMPHQISSGRKSCFRWPWIAAFISCHFPLRPAWHGNVLEAARALE